MQILLNGEKVVIQKPGTSLAQLVEQFQLNPKTLVLEYNAAILGEADWPYIQLKENDRIEIIQFVGGG
jgi:sulfur carrier protein